ncbi:MAG: nitroreductase family protein [Candidatus Thermoplasmatota archaeon]|nr:nitroreductase family protein [Candidatus Thermoplasmatota archaeon]
MVPYKPERPSPEETTQRARAFREHLDGRRSVRMFSQDPVPRETIEEILEAAGTAPSGAHKQPWTFVAIEDPALKAQLREAAEEQERRFYDELAPDDWLEDLAPLGTDWEKTHLTDAPWVIVVFAQDYAMGEDGERAGKHYYVNESVGIACGFLLCAIRQAGLSALTHTPSPMKFLQEVLARPKNERAYLVVPVGYPAEDAQVPDLDRKALDDFVVWR